MFGHLSNHFKRAIPAHCGGTSHAARDLHHQFIVKISYQRWQIRQRRTIFRGYRLNSRTVLPAMRKQWMYADRGLAYGRNQVDWLSGIAFLWLVGRYLSESGRSVCDISQSCQRLYPKHCLVTFMLPRMIYFRLRNLQSRSVSRKFDWWVAILPSNGFENWQAIL